MSRIASTRRVSLGLSLLTGLALLMGACGGDSPKSTVATPTGTQPTTAAANPTTIPASATPASPAATATPNAYSAPSGARILELDRQLTSVIGPRPAGSAKEKETAGFLANQLRAFGYEVEMQTFSSSTATGRESTLSVRTPDLRTVPNVPFQGSAEANLRAPLVSAGEGGSSDFPASARGAIALVVRGPTFFRDMLTNAQAAGASGLIVMNSEPGTFFGTLESKATIPVVAISQTEGRNLIQALANGTVQAELSVIDNSTSVNVIARPPGKACETVTGGHYDTVAVSPGGSDNSSGTATVVEIAGVMAARNEMGANCFVLFAAEEPGLLGSKAYVASMDAAARQRLKVMLNFDMTGFGNGSWAMITSSSMLSKALAIAKRENIDAESPGSVRSDSDHYSFYLANLPIVWLYAGPDPVFHTPRDTIDHIQPAMLEQAVRFGVAFLESINGGG